jgi:hypothetical protein
VGERPQTASITTAKKKGTQGLKLMYSKGFELENFKL